MLNKQEILNIAVPHLRKQNARSFFDDDEGEVCAYRSPDGLKCAIGVLIPNEMYLPEMEGQSVSSLLSNPKYNNLPFFNTENEDEVRFLAQLQNIHDYEDIEDWEDAFQSLATIHSLIVPE